MDSSKIKNFIIMLLLIVNAFFLSVVASDNLSQRAARKGAVEDAAAILTERGIAVSAEAELGERRLSVCGAKRDLDRELKLVSALLGKTTAIDQGGGIIYYSGAQGQACFRGTGDFDIVLDSEAYHGERTPESTAKALAEKLGLDAVPAGSTMGEGGSGEITLLCSAKGAAVLNCRVVLTFSGGKLLLVMGTRPLDDVTESGGGAEPLDVPTVLMRFLDIVNQGGYVCSELRDVELCYLQSASASGSGELTPVWRLLTDSGQFCLNALTGRQELLT